MLIVRFLVTHISSEAGWLATNLVPAKKGSVGAEPTNKLVGKFASVYRRPTARFVDPAGLVLATRIMVMCCVLVLNVCTTSLN